MEELIQIGQMPGFECENRVYDWGGLCPALKIGGDPKKILEVIKLEDRHIDVVAERGRAYRGQAPQLEVNKEGISNTVTTVEKDNLILEEYVHVSQATKEGTIPCRVGGVADLNYPTSQTRRGRVQGSGEICPTLTTENIPSVIEPWIWEIDGQKYRIRIRKLTPRECWRLMDFDDEDFDKAKFDNETVYLEGGEKKCNAKLKVVTEKQRQKDMVTYASCITNDLQSMEILKTICSQLARQQENENTVNVCIATEKLEKMEHLECATNIIKCITYMGIHFTLMEEKDQQVMVIIARVKKDSTSTEKCMKILRNQT